MNQQLEDYIKQARVSGQTDAQIMTSLLQSGWSQAQVNDAFGIPNPQMAAPPPPPPENLLQQQPNFENPLMKYKPTEGNFAKFDEKTIATMKASAIWSTVSSVITSVAGMVSSYYFVSSLYNNSGPYGAYVNSYVGQVYTPQLISVGGLITAVVWGIIGGAISGWVIAKYYHVFLGWQQKFTGNRLNSFFKILFWPYLVGFVLALILTGALSLAFSGFLALIITFVADIVAVYIYAKMMDKSVGKYYQ